MAGVSQRFAVRPRAFVHVTRIEMSFCWKGAGVRGQTSGQARLLLGFRSSEKSFCVPTRG
jgi:hypothetical protein